MNKNTSFRRILNEIKSIDKEASECEKMFKLSMVENDMFHWEAILYGPEDSLYFGCQFKLDIKIPFDYPKMPPKVKFITPILHVNINNQGDICLDILKDKWKGSSNIRAIMFSIILLLGQPNYDDPYNLELAQLYKTDQITYKNNIKKFCSSQKNK